jgi:hypothetical protein
MDSQYSGSGKALNYVPIKLRYVTTATNNVNVCRMICSYSKSSKFTAPWAVAAAGLFAVGRLDMQDALQAAQADHSGDGVVVGPFLSVHGDSDNGR